MWRRLRVLVIALLCVAVPMQGVAAATMALCVPAPRVAAVSHPDDHASHDAMAHEAHAWRAGASPRAADTADRQDGHTTTSLCSVCASCHLGAGAVPPMLAFDPVPPSRAYASLVGDRPVAYVTDGLERPPRTPGP